MKTIKSYIDVLPPLMPPDPSGCQPSLVRCAIPFMYGLLGVRQRVGCEEPDAHGVHAAQMFRDEPLIAMDTFS
ncbi:MAG: hypothetical protein H7210_00305 [Pyrinomonadaceae bacterium]|nr:hypothetical protein [Phycisphaerales bacterium]